MSTLSRRRLLALSGGVATVAIAGCSDSDDEPDGPTGDDGNGDNDGDGNGNSDNDGNDDDDGETDESSETELTGTVLGNIDIENLSSDSHTIDVIVEFDNAFEDWKTVTLEGRSGTTLDRNWSTDPGSFRVIGRLDEGEPIEVTPGRWNDPDCLNLDVLVRSGELTISGRTDGGPCSSDDS